MTKDQLLKEIKDNTCPPWYWTDINDAVDKYSTALKEENERLRNLLIAYKNMVGNTGYSIAKEEAQYLYNITTHTLNKSTVKEVGNNETI